MSPFIVETDIPSFFQQLKRYIYLIAEEYKNINPKIYQNLINELKSLPEYINHRNFPRYADGEHLTIERNSIKIMPLSKNHTQVSIQQEDGFNSDVYLELIKHIKSHPFFEREYKLRTIEPSINSPIEEWFQYQLDNPVIRISLKNIADKKNLSYGYVRQLHANWIKQRKQNISKLSW
jgi:hypothetical protein